MLGALSSWHVLICSGMELLLSTKLSSLDVTTSYEVVSTIAVVPSMICIISQNVLEIAQPFFTRKDVRRDGSIHTLVPH